MVDSTPPKKTPPPTSKSFEDLPLSSQLRQGIRDLGYETPTPIQSGTIADAVGGRDLIGSAQTGTGKTAAFLLPILERLLREPSGRIHTLVLTPTRELAIQAATFVSQLGRHTRIRGAAVYGGVGMADQERALRGGAEIIIATPGRLLDHMNRGYVNFRDVKILVLDEADRMLDMGFLPDVRRIIERLPRQRQTMLFSATMPPEVVKLSRDFLRDPKTVQIGATTAAAVGISHLALPVPAQLKAVLLKELLQDQAMTSVLVFARTKHRADRLAHQLSRWGIDAALIHGDRSQSQRIHALEGFRSGRHRILVATDIAARGIDVEGVSHVVNYDVPDEPEVYIHRVGRTARAQRRGDAFTLVSPDEEDNFSRIEQLLGIEILRAKIPGFHYDQAPPEPLPARSRSAFGARRGGQRRFQRDSDRGRRQSPRRVQRPNPRQHSPQGRKTW